ncbi:MAG: hypothetical protein M1828_002513 [Chrysothrix sp. TS-e1954]|nr:MAG: hypothetical protein M1828_002513 [Chrysothrix sp. TS-e1954]
MSEENGSQLHVAIIGAGLTGLVLALALENRHIQYTIYEQAASIPSTGAGLNTNPAGARSLKYISAEAFAAYKAVRTTHHRYNDELYFTYTDGSSHVDLMCTEEFGSVHRVRYIDELVKRVPAEKIRLGHRVKNVTQSSPSHAPLLSFENGSSISCDVVLGCDGVKSKIRPIVVGEDHASAKASFSHRVVYRGLVGRHEAEKALGSKMMDGALLHVGCGACFVSYPATEDVMSFGLFIPHPEPWPHFPSVSHKADKQELLATLKDLHPNVLKVGKLLPDTLDVWAVYDTHDSPLPTYSKGCIAVLGDAAHASTPNLGSAAGIAYEDAAVVATLLGDIQKTLKSQNSGGATVEQRRALQQQISHALTAYTTSCIERSQWLVQASRYLGECNTMDAYGGVLDLERLVADTKQRYDIVWNKDIVDIVKSARETRDKLELQS